jgi:hypothetical protein
VGIDDQHLVRRTPAYRRARRCQRLAHKTSNLLALAAMSLREIYCGLLWYARHGPHRRWKDEFAACAFRDIFGVWPRPQDKAEPARPPIELEEWINTRQRRRPKARGTAA